MSRTFTQASTGLTLTVDNDEVANGMANQPDAYKEVGGKGKDVSDTSDLKQPSNVPDQKATVLPNKEQKLKESK